MDNKTKENFTNFFAHVTAIAVVTALFLYTWNSAIAPNCNLFTFTYLQAYCGIWSLNWILSRVGSRRS